MSVLLWVGAAMAAGIVVLLFRHHRRRQIVYRDLRDKRTASIADFRPSELSDRVDQVLRQRFLHERLVHIPGFLNPGDLEVLRSSSRVAARYAERSLIPGHKKGGTLAYEAMHRHAPACLAFYHSEQLRKWLGEIIGSPVFPTADHDQSACSVLYYDRPGDHIGWHFDHNFYRGRHFTVLLSLANHALGPDREATGAPSDGILQQRVDGRIDAIPTPANTLVLFEGANVFHRATAIGRDQLRVMLSMTFATDPRVHPWKEIIRRIKDTAYFGPRVLFD
jgi:hypothetical protein